MTRAEMGAAAGHDDHLDRTITCGVVESSVNLLDQASILRIVIPRPSYCYPGDPG
jgi:hypothetical protein